MVLKDPILYREVDDWWEKQDFMIMFIQEIIAWEGSQRG